MHEVRVVNQVKMCPGLNSNYDFNHDDIPANKIHSDNHLVMSSGSYFTTAGLTINQSINLEIYSVDMF